MSENASSADNQQGSCSAVSGINPSETTRRAPILGQVIKAYFLGALHDGTFSSNRRFRIAQKGDEWLQRLKSLLKVIGYNAWVYREGKNRDVYVLETLANFLDFHCNPIDLEDEEERIAYIRGFFDAEGGIPRNKTDRFYIQLVQKDKDKLEKIKYILNHLGIKTGIIHNPSQRVDPEYWRMYVLADSHNLFIQKIGSWHPRKISVLRNREVI